VSFHGVVEAMPTRAIYMDGDYPIIGPTDGAPPPPFPMPQAPDIPHIGNPIPVFVDKVEYAWSDVSSWVSDRWHSVSSWFGGVGAAAAEDVNTVVDNAINAAQTAWASFVSTLEAWITEGLYAAAAATLDVGLYVRSTEISLWHATEAAIDDVWHSIWDNVVGIDQAIDALRQYVDDVAHYVAGGVEAWAIDTIYHPLLKDIQRVERDVFDALDGAITDVEGYAADLVHSEALRRAAAIAGVVAAVATITTWVEECGAPMCEQMGPNTNFSKVLKLLNLAGMLALLTSFGTLTEEQLEQLAATVVGLGEAPAATFVDLFVTEGDTLAQAIASTLPTLVP
jgi:hypothetical protein